MKKNKLAEKIQKLGESGQYDQQAQELLKEAGVMLEVIKAVPQHAPLWAQDGKHGTCYSVSIGKLEHKPVEGAYVGVYADYRGHFAKEIQFFFWNSIAAKEEGSHRMAGEKKPGAYSILASLYMPVENFADFCSNFGYSEDSRQAEKTYREVIELNTKLETIFSPEELEALQEIA